MRRATVIGAAVVVALIVFVLVLDRYSTMEQNAEPGTAAPQPAPAIAVPAAVATHAHSGLIYGRVTGDGATYEGRLRWGGDQEATWSDFYDGAKAGNAWAVHAPLRSGESPKGVEIFGFEFGGPDRSHLRRQFLARFGDIARIDAHVANVKVTLRSGTVIELDRFDAGDIDDGVRVWDRNNGVVNLDSRRIRTIEFLPTAPLLEAPGRLHGVVRSRQGEFTGFIQWNQQDGVDTDTLDGRTNDGEVHLRYDGIRSIARQSGGTTLVTQLDGRVNVLTDADDVGRRNRGIYVDDRRYGRVLISWDAFEQVAFSAGGSGPSYGDFAPGRPLQGTVTSRDGRRLAGRLVYDFDESESSETLDVSFQGVSYAIPFELIASIVPINRDYRGAAPGRVVLRSGEELPVDRNGDVGERNAGVLVFADGREQPELVLWSDVERIDFDIHESASWQRGGRMDSPAGD